MVELSMYSGVPVSGCIWPSLTKVIRMGQAR